MAATLDQCSATPAASARVSASLHVCFKMAIGAIAEHRVEKHTHTGSSDRTPECTTLSASPTPTVVADPI